MCYISVAQGFDIHTLYVDAVNIIEILSPLDTNGDGRYDNMQDVLWILQASENKELSLAIIDIDIQYGENCEFDSLQVSVCTHK